MLSKYERNELFELIQQSELELADFDPPREDERGFTVIRNLSTGSSLAIAERDSLGVRRIAVDGYEPPISGTWQEVVQRWLNVVHVTREDIERDRNTPDLWAEFARERETLSGTTPAPEDNTPFTADEQAEIEWRLHEIAEYAIESGKFEDEELRTLSAKIDYLIESSKHSRRFDWREQVVGAFLSAVVGNLLPQGATMDVLNMVVGTVGHLMGHPVLGLPQ
jgi:hypothetical protein